MARAQTGVDGQGDRKRQRGFLVEDRNVLLVIVFLENEILLRQPADGSAVLVGHGHEYVDQVDVDTERGGRLGLRGS